MIGAVMVSYPESVTDPDYDSMLELGKSDYEVFKQGRQRCLDAGGCPECFCVAAEQGREHWGHCSRFTERETNELIARL